MRDTQTTLLAYAQDTEIGGYQSWLQIESSQSEADWLGFVEIMAAPRSFLTVREQALAYSGTCRGSRALGDIRNCDFSLARDVNSLAGFALELPYDFMPML
jgi:hypothetical protein